MAKGILVVESRPADPDREHEYNEWYSGMHLKDVCAVPGFVGARRYKVPGSDPASYIAIYEIEADDLAAPLDELRARGTDGRMAMSDVLQMDPPPTVTLYELIE
jgi:hypothetical protein